MRKLRLLNICDVSHLYKQLGTSSGEVSRICRNPERYYKKGPRLIKGKIRFLATPHGRLRVILDKLQQLLQRLYLPENVHGGVKEHSTLTNAAQHLRKPTVVCMDIKDFFPSISNRRVYSMFQDTLGCAPEVARILTRLCTLDGSLPQGSPTSTIVAGLSAVGLTRRLDRLAECHNATYTQYVDDVTMSGPRHVSRMTSVVAKIIQQEGFKVNTAKTTIAEGGQEKCVTGIRVNVALDVSSKKMKEVKDLLEAKKSASLSQKEVLSVEGKIAYIARLNPGAGHYLRRSLKKKKTSSYQYS